MSETACAHRESGRNCPISKTPCLGECIYANILDDISLGIIGLDTARKEVFFQNKQAIEIFKAFIKPKDYQCPLRAASYRQGPADLPIKPV